MHEPPASPTDPSPEPVRKKGFWYWSIWGSFAGILLPLGICGWLGKRAIVVMGQAMEENKRVATDASLDAVGAAVENAMLYFTVGSVVPVLAILWLIVSVIFHLRQPKKVPS